MNFDADKFLPDLEGLDLCIERKREIILTLHAIMESAIDEAFGVHPVQLSQQENNLQHPAPSLDSKQSKLRSTFSRSSGFNDSER